MYSLSGSQGLVIKQKDREIAKLLRRIDSIQHVRHLYYVALQNILYGVVHRNFSTEEVAEHIKHVLMKAVEVTDGSTE